ncbi:pancreatic triacylglycerol lipase [Cephus cinctus]|uniref:phospholipase A1 n=1 Tax=Cephus cinctus TaxID=211228 RepID=A0AAJ7FCD9_CEPCN|nr:pancreatic triacylglycerol lipase [Cephus cinctus]
MKNSHALVFCLFVVAVRGFPSIPEKNVAEARLAVEDDDRNLVDLDLNFRDIESIRETQKDLANKVKFYLHTLKNPKNTQQLWLNDPKTLSQSNFNPSKPTRIVTHGWMNSAKSDACRLVREAYLKHGEYNVIIVDWSRISKLPYVYASNRVKIVGQYVGKMIDFLASRGMNTINTLVVGHSLGAHVAGIAARNAKSTVGYVVALDPALPLFSSAKPGDRVAKGDAKFVQVIHTNAGALGYSDPIGDVDFYPNGGRKQAGCVVEWIATSHSRSYRFFAESINSKTGFVATQCESYSKFTSGGCRGNKKEMMGGPKPTTTATRSFYLDTNGSAPYAKGG